MTINIDEHNQTKLKEASEYMGLPEDEIVNLAVKSYLSAEEEKAKAQLHEEMRAWRELSIESLLRHEDELANDAEHAGG